MGMDGDLASIYGNIHNEIHSGWAEEGRGDCRVNRSRGKSKICGRNIARIPVNRVEAAFVNFTYCRGTEGGGGRRMRRRSSPSRREKNSRLGKPSTLKQRCKLLFGASARKRSYPTYRNRAAKAGREFTFQGVERGETNVPGLSSRS